MIQNSICGCSSSRVIFFFYSNFWDLVFLEIIMTQGGWLEFVRNKIEKFSSLCLLGLFGVLVVMYRRKYEE